MEVNKMVAEPKNHHYVPRFYLKRFSEDRQEKAYVLFKKSKNRGSNYISESPVSLDKICSEKYFYALQDNDNQKNMQIEKRLSEYEGFYNDLVFLHLPSEGIFPIQQGAKFLDSIQKALLTDFVTMQIRRGLMSRKIGKTLAEEKYNNVLNDARIKFKDDNHLDSDLEYLYRDKKRIINNALIFTAIPNGSIDWSESELNQYLSNMNCMIFLNTTNLDFVTSDEPILLYNQLTKQTGLYHCPLESIYTNIFFPIGPKSLIYMCHKEFCKIENNNVVRVSFLSREESNFVHDLNNMQYELSHRFVIAQKRETLIDILND